jgi:hypothetical protein
VRIGSLFTGYGGLDCAVEQFFNGETVWTCDNDPGASKIIAHRYPVIPNLADVTTADNSGRAGGLNLRTATTLLPTPTAMDSKASGGSSPSDVTLTDAVVRTLLGATTNPRFADGRES